jgi:hypothetical protein
MVGEGKTEKAPSSCGRGLVLHGLSAFENAGRGRDWCSDRYDIRLSRAHIIPVLIATGFVHMVMVRGSRKRMVVLIGSTS